MNRRTLITSLGGLAASSAFAVSSGAFTSVTAKRSVTVETAQDDTALLRLDDLGAGTGFGDNGRSIENADGEVEFTFPGIGRRNTDESLGLGRNSVYEFDRDSDSTEDGLLEITNQGTQTVKVYSEHETSSELEIELYDVTDSSKTALNAEPATLDTGEHVDVGFRIQTFGADIRTFDETLTIVAEATDG